MEKDKNKKTEVNSMNLKRRSNLNHNNNDRKVNLTNNKDVDDLKISDEYYSGNNPGADGEDF